MESERQGQGVGSALFEGVLEECDAEGLPAYLESSNERNLPLYRRHGCEVIEDLQLWRNRPTLSLRLLRPREAAAA